MQTLSKNPHSMLVASSINGLLALEKARLESRYTISDWQRPPYQKKEKEMERVCYGSPLQARTPSTTEEGVAFRQWLEKNRFEIEYAEALINQATDLTILKKLPA
jgi:hypothetical protein